MKHREIHDASTSPLRSYYSGIALPMEEWLWDHSITLFWSCLAVISGADIQLSETSEIPVYWTSHVQEIVISAVTQSTV